MALPLVNRAAILLKGKQAFLDWINDYPGSDPPLKLEDINAELTVYLIPEQAVNADDWLKSNYPILFEEELEAWYTDEDYWPKDRSYEMFSRFFEVQFSSMVMDTMFEPILTDEELEDEEDDDYDDKVLN